jgi:hypothetical protein
MAVIVRVFACDGTGWVSREVSVKVPPSRGRSQMFNFKKRGLTLLAPSGSTLVARFGRTNLYRAPSAVGTSSSELSAMFGGGFTRGQHYSSESQMSTSLTARIDPSAKNKFREISAV